MIIHEERVRFQIDSGSTVNLLPKRFLTSQDEIREEVVKLEMWNKDERNCCRDGETEISPVQKRATIIPSSKLILPCTSQRQGQEIKEDAVQGRAATLF